MIGRNKRNSLVKIMKEKLGNLKSCRYREMSIQVSIQVDCTVVYSFSINDKKKFVTFLCLNSFKNRGNNVFLKTRS